MKTEAIFDNIANRIEEQINLAEDKIFIAVAWFTNKNLFQALCKKASEGVKVKLVISDNEINRNSTINHSDIQIGKSKLYWIETHNKFCIIDDYVVITGSYNWSYKAENNLENIIICSGDNDLVKQFKKELKRIIKDYPQEDGIRPLLKRTEAEKSGSIKPNILPVKNRDCDNPLLRPSVKNNFESLGIKPNIVNVENRDHDTPPAIPSIKNDFESIKIGEQEWMLKNLDVDRFRNGDLIPHIKDKEEWIKAGQNRKPGWCYYENDPENGMVYGRLYNWYAVNDKRGLAPAGWHVPHNADWIQLENYLGGKKIASNKLRLVGTAYWFPPNNGATDDFRFSALPGGHRNRYGNFEYIRFIAKFWSAIEHFNDINFSNYLSLASGYLIQSFYDFSYTYKSSGVSVRCIKNL